MNAERKRELKVVKGKAARKCMNTFGDWSPVVNGAMCWITNQGQGDIGIQCVSWPHRNSCLLTELYKSRVSLSNFLEAPTGSANRSDSETTSCLYWNKTSLISRSEGGFKYLNAGIACRHWARKFHGPVYGILIIKSQTLDQLRWLNLDWITILTAKIFTHILLQSLLVFKSQFSCKLSPIWKYGYIRLTARRCPVFKLWVSETRMPS